MSGGSGTRADPWVLCTPPGQSEYAAFRDESLDPPALVAQVGTTEVRYHLRCLDDLHAMLVPPWRQSAEIPRYGDGTTLQTT